MSIDKYIITMCIRILEDKVEEYNLILSLLKQSSDPCKNTLVKFEASVKKIENCAELLKEFLE